MSPVVCSVPGGFGWWQVAVYLCPCSSAVWGRHLSVSTAYSYLTSAENRPNSTYTDIPICPFIYGKLFLSPVVSVFSASTLHCSAPCQDHQHAIFLLGRVGFGTARLPPGRGSCRGTAGSCAFHVTVSVPCPANRNSSGRQRATLPNPRCPEPRGLFIGCTLQTLGVWSRFF